MNVSNEIQFIILASEPFPEKVSRDLLREIIPKIDNWKWLSECAVRNSVAPLIFYNLKAIGLINDLQPKYIDIFENNYKNSGIRSLKLRSTFIEITEKLLSEGIEIIALKGIAFQHELYSNPALRPMIDIDLLIKEAQIEEALRILNLMGCKAFAYSESKYIDALKHHYPPLFYKGIAIEIHRSLVDAYDPVQIPLTKIWEKAQKSRLEGLNMFTLAQNHQLLYTCHHVFNTLRGGSVKLIWYTDIISFLQKQCNSIQIDEFEQLLESTNAKESVFHSLITANYLFKEHFFEDELNPVKNKYCPHPQEILLYIEKSSVSPELSHYYQKFLNIKSISGKLRYLNNRMFPDREFIEKKYRTSGFASLSISYLREFFGFILLGIRILFKKFFQQVNNNKRME
jgi:hypothetical protein